VKFINLILDIFRKDKPHLYFSPQPDNQDIVKGGERFNPYPEKTFLGEQGLYAYYVLMVLKYDEFSLIQKVIVRRLGNHDLKNGTILRNQNQESLAISYYEDFGGVVVEVTTNSLPMILEIDAHSFAPAPPWVVFPKLEPIELEMNKQGSIDYWWSHIWLPFWSTRTEAEKRQYLFDNRANAKWSEALS
jgi:hypothetical protein